ncbi:ketopantoate reductase PanE/ApbA C terminal-domain-containing protein [Lactarius sanguifluus]|nr:ketopantoate reductase PanE/ApbA C terminal-domain-containing protein [Lactarius sanguifluus]
MRFHVLGLGPIGSLVSHHLSKTLDATKHEIVLVHKSAQQLKKANLARNVLKVEREGVVETSTAFRSEIFEAATQHRYERRQANLHARAARKSENKRAAGLKSSENENDTAQHTLLPIESLIVTLKAYTVVDAVKALTRTIVLLHNGMGVYERLVDDVFRNPDQRPHFIVASNDHGAWNKDYLHTIHAGVGSITFGIVTDPRGRDFEASVEEGEGPEQERIVVPRMTSCPPQGDDSTYRTLRNTTAMKRKLVVNTVVNPLTALLGCRNGDLLESGESMKIMKPEAFARQAQAQQEGGSWNDRDNRARIRSGFSRVSPALSAHALEEECLRVIRINAGNTSSMLSDVRSGSYTEIDYMAGYLVGLGRSFNLPMSTTTTLLNLIKLRTTIPLDCLTYK